MSNNNQHNNNNNNNNNNNINHSQNHSISNINDIEFKTTDACTSSKNGARVSENPFKW